MIHRKYIHLFKLSWEEALQYKAELFTWTLIDLLPLCSLLLLWFGVYQYGESFPGYTLDSLITYYIIGHIITKLVAAHFEEDAIHQVNDGRISKFLIIPLSYKARLFLIEVAWKVMGLILVTTPIVIGIRIFLSKYLFIPPATTIITIAILIMLGFLIDCLLSFIIVASAFYLEQARSLSHAKWIITGIFSGSMLPLSLYPQWLEKIARILPLQYLNAVPIEVYLGQKDNLAAIGEIIKASMWIAALWLIMSLMWNKAIGKYTAVGN